MGEPHWSSLAYLPAAGLPEVDLGVVSTEFCARAGVRLVTERDEERAIAAALEAERVASYAVADARRVERETRARDSMRSALQPWTDPLQSPDRLAATFAENAHAYVDYTGGHRIGYLCGGVVGPFGIRVEVKLDLAEELSVLAGVENFVGGIFAALNARGLDVTYSSDGGSLLLSPRRDAPEPLQRVARELAPQALADPEYVALSEEADRAVELAVAYLTGLPPPGVIYLTRLKPLGEEQGRPAPRPGTLAGDIAKREGLGKPAPCVVGRTNSSDLELTVPGTRGFSERALRLAAMRVQTHVGATGTRLGRGGWFQCTADADGLRLFFRFKVLPHV